MLVVRIQIWRSRLPQSANFQEFAKYPFFGSHSEVGMWAVALSSVK
jgi:hypothetical protein